MPEEASVSGLMLKSAPMMEGEGHLLRDSADVCQELGTGPRQPFNCNQVGTTSESGVPSRNMHDDTDGPMLIDGVPTRGR
eukprot:1604298-Pyramimonas_sp.AAC.1